LPSYASPNVLELGLLLNALPGGMLGLLGLGIRKLLNPELVPGLTSPALSFCSSFQSSTLAMSCSTSYRLVSPRCKERNDKKTFVTSVLSTFSEALPFLSMRKALVRWSFNVTASCRSLQIGRASCRERVYG